MADAFQAAARGLRPAAALSRALGGAARVGLGLGGAVEAEKSTGKGASSKLRRPLQPIDLNSALRPQAGSSQAKTLGKRPLGAALASSKQVEAKREAKTANVKEEEEETRTTDPVRENLAWMDMLLALLEKKYGPHSVASVALSDLEDAKMFAPRAKKQRTEAKQEDSKQAADSSQVRTQMEGEGHKGPIEGGRQDQEKDEKEREERRRQLLLRYAQQIQDSSMHSSTTCGCKTGCLKMYCVCFSSRGFCHSSCSCDDCKNSRAYKDERLQAIQSYLANDPRAFSYASHHQTTTATGFLHLLPQKSNAVVQRGCRCKKSKCLKKYCECFQNGIACTAHCRCVECSNHTDSAHLTSKNSVGTAPKQSALAAASPTAQPFHQVQVTVTKQPKRNSVRKSIRLNL